MAKGFKTYWGKEKILRSFPGGSAGKESACNVGDPGLVPGLERSTGKGTGNPLQYSCLENPMDRGAWQTAVHGVTKSWTRLNDFTSLRSKKKVEVIEWKHGGDL